MECELHGTLAGHLTDLDDSWSIGTFGAIAEFHQDRDDVLRIDDRAALTRATLRGAIRLDRDMLPEIRPIAYETLSPRPHRWSQGVALCLPVGRAEGARRSVLTELGPDAGAVRSEDRHAILFDMGLGLPQIDFCVRTDDEALIEALRANAGRSPFDPESAAMAAILRHHPHRVAISNIGRAEVYQIIGGPDTGGVSPPGPHTHVLPRLLKSGRTHSANVPIPDELVPCGYLHPSNPVIGPMGEDRAFDPRLFAAFQSLLELYGRREYVAAKSAVNSAVAAGISPANYAVPAGRLPRTALRIALRQMARKAEHQGDTVLLARVGTWRASFDPAEQAEELEDDALGH